MHFTSFLYRTLLLTLYITPSISLFFFHLMANTLSPYLSPSLSVAAIVVLLVSCGILIQECEGQGQQAKALPPAGETCNGIFISYDFLKRTKEYPHVKNVTAQSWAFSSTASVLNTGKEVFKAWKLFIEFQHDEILVSVGGGNIEEATEFPASVGNGTTFVGASQPDLDSAINTAQDLSQIQAVIDLTGTQFGVKPPTVPMPKTIKLVNDGYKCPKPTTHKSSMYACCKKDPKAKIAVAKKTKFLARQKGDLLISYDVTQVYDDNYLVQVLMENEHFLGRLDHWNLTWEWTRGEFIYSMKGAFTREIESLGCINGEAGKYYAGLDFSKVLNCQKNPIVSDLPSEKYNDSELGKIPNCCKDGNLLPIIMDPSKSKSAFTMQVYKIPPDLNKTAIYPPEKWQITGILNPHYKCGLPRRVEPARFPDSRGLEATVIAISSWQIVCNITKPTKRSTRCCVSFSSYYNDSVVPCNTCACGCDSVNTKKCNPNSPAMLLPAEALLLPFENRSAKTVAWAKMKHFTIPKRLPCADNCEVSINWHVVSDYKGGWSARITMFNWMTTQFENWFTALQFKKTPRGYQAAYSFNATTIPKLNHTIFLQGFIGANYLIALDNKSNPHVPGKQQSVISFTKKYSPNIKIAKGDGFPSKVFFNGEECSLPTRFPVKSGNQPNVVVDLAYQLLFFALAFTITPVL
ncbi:COBRA-like protein 10 [Vigna umbellata]|uniref:COBRA-like protein 10 n=1 Tax=Vigna umbellata TaxID=87088 RepID=UPI001F5FC00E|nr:COBRA-like protein 10 [Vigna umbellata]